MVIQPTILILCVKADSLKKLKWSCGNKTRGRIFPQLFQLISDKRSGCCIRECSLDSLAITLMFEKRSCFHLIQSNRECCVLNHKPAFGAQSPGTLPESSFPLTSCRGKSHSGQLVIITTWNSNKIRLRKLRVKWPLSLHGHAISAINGKSLLFFQLVQ